MISPSKATELATNIREFEIEDVDRSMPRQDTRVVNKSKDQVNASDEEVDRLDGEVDESNEEIDGSNEEVDALREEGDEVDVWMVGNSNNRDEQAQMKLNTVLFYRPTTTTAAAETAAARSSAQFYRLAWPRSPPSSRPATS